MVFLQITEHNQDSQSRIADDEIIIGIDLGTTNSLVSLVENGKVKTIADADGKDIHPSLVEYDCLGNFFAVSANLASPLLSKENHIVIPSIKRLMGKGLEDIFSQQFPFQITEDEQREVGKSGLKIIIGNKKITPEEVSSEILKYLKNLAEKNLKTEIKKAVITVPAYFDEAAKNATKLAAKLAGLEVVRLVNEPTAAALAYGLENASEGLYCVYDLGGGTFDVSILKMQKGIFRVLGVAGDNQLGGDDFDNLMVDLICKTSSECSIADQCWTKSLARKIKEDLSEKDSVLIENPSDNFSFSREEFEKLIFKKVQKTIDITKNLIDDLQLEANDIKGLILVGGSTRIPLIRKKLTEIFGKEKILTNLDPDRVVAIGAAWQAYGLSGHARGGGEQNLLLDVVPLSLGIEMMGGVVEKIILRNSAIPTSVTKEFTTYADNQTGMKFHILQGERELARDCRSLANFEIKNIPTMKAGMARIAVTFVVDADGLLTISAQEKITEQKQEIVTRPSYSLNEQEVKNMLLDSFKNSKSDMQNRLLAETIVEEKKNIMIAKDDLQNFFHLITKQEAELIEKAVKILENSIVKNDDRATLLQAGKDLEKTMECLVLKKINLALERHISGKKISDLEN